MRPSGRNAHDTRCSRAKGIIATRRQDGAACRRGFGLPHGTSGAGAASQDAQSAELTGGGLVLTGQLPDLGEVLTISRNAHVILAEYGSYPALRPRADGLAAADDDSRLFTDFTRWGVAEARREPAGSDLDTAGGEALFSLTFRDVAGDAFHRLCLLPGSDLARFHALVRRHGGVPVPPGTGQRASTQADAGVGGGEIVAMQRTRLPALRARAAGTGRCDCGRPGCIDNVLPLKLPPATLPSILQRVAGSALPLRVTLFQQAIVHTARFTPLPQRDRQAGAGPGGGPGGCGWIFAQDEHVGLHLRPAGFAALWFTLPAAGSGGESCLEAYDAHGELLAAFAPANPAQDEAAWRSLVWSR